MCSLTARLAAEGLSVYSPIVNCHAIAVHGGADPTDADMWLSFDKPMMDAADALVVAKMISWEMSFGIAEEIEEFASAGKPIYFLEPESMVVTKA